MVYTSKIPIPGKTPIGSATGGGYMYADEPSMSPTQNMSTPIKPFTPITSESTGIPNVGVPGVPGITPLVPGIQPTAENAAKINAPVDDVLQINQKIDNNSERVKQLRQHFTALEQKGEYQLDQKQSDYIKRFKTKNPSYENVPDVILYSKIILADPKRQEELGNVGEKSFMQRLGDATLGTITDTGDAIMEGVQAYKDYKPEGIMEQGVAVTSGLGKFVGDTFTNVGANLINLGLPSKDNLQGTTSTSELLGKNVREAPGEIGKFVADKIDWAMGEGWTKQQVNDLIETTGAKEKFAYLINHVQSNPEAMKEFEAAMNILNILPGGFAGKTKKALNAKQVLKNIARDAELTVGKKGLLGTATKEAFDAGMNRSFKDFTFTGAKSLNDVMSKLPEKKLPGKSIGTKVTRTIPEKTISNYLDLTPTERSNVEKILGGKTAEQYILENNLGGKTKGELTDIFQKQASDSYNGIKEKLAPIADRIESKGAKTAIDDMLETFDSLSSLEKDVYKRDIDYLRTLKDQNDYSLSELHALRQAFDKVNTGMYTAKGAVRSGTRAGAEVEVRNQLSNDIQENALKQGVDVKKMNQDLRVALTLKDGLLRSLSQKSKNNLVGLQDIGIMGIFSGGEPLTALSLGIGKKFLEGKMPSAAQKLFNLNKNAYENTAVKRGNTIATGNGSRLFGLSDNVGSSDAASIPKVKPNVIISKNPAEILAFEVSNGKVDIKKAIQEIKKLSPEEIAKHPELVKLQEVDQIVQYIDNVGAEYGALPPDEIQALTKQIQEGGYTPEQKKYILDNSPKEVTTEIQKQNRIRDYGKDFTEKEVVKVSDKPKLKAKTEKKVKAKKETPEVVSTPETVNETSIDKELQSIQESAPENQEVLQMPEDYMPTDGLPTGEETIKTIQPKKFSKKDIKDIGPMYVNAIDADGNSFFLIKGKIDGMPEGRKLERKVQDIGGDASTPIAVESTGTYHGVGGHVLFDDGTVVNELYLNKVKKAYPDATFYVDENNKFAPIVAKIDNEVVGVIMPTKDGKIGFEPTEAPKTPQVEGKTDMLEVGKKFEMNSNMMDRKGKSVEFNDKIEITKVGDEFIEYKTDTGAVGSINKESFFNKVMDGKIKSQSPIVEKASLKTPQTSSGESSPFKTAIDDIEARIAKADGKKTYTDQLGESFVGGQVGFKSGKASEIKKIDRAFEQNTTKAREINALSKELDEVKSLQRGYEKNKKLLSAFETQLEKGKTSGEGFTTKEFMSEIERIKKDIARFERSKYFDKPKQSLPLSQKSEVKYSEADEIGNYRNIPKGADNVPEYANGLRAGGREYIIDGEKVYMNGGFENGGRDYIVQSFGVENKGKGVGTNAIRNILDKVFQNKGKTGFTKEFTVYSITPGAKGFWKKIADKFGGEMDDSTIPTLKITRDNYLKSNK